MKKIILVISLVLLFLFGCDENEQEENYGPSTKKDPLGFFTNEDGKYDPKDEFHKKLGEIDREMFFAKTDIEINILFSCIYFEDGELAKDYEDILGKFNVENQKKLCDIFKEIDKKYYYLYEETINNKKAPEQLFSFRFMEENEKESSVAGLFPTLNDCNIYYNKFKDLDLFINNCKEHKSISELFGIDPLNLFDED